MVGVIKDVNVLRERTKLLNEGNVIEHSQLPLDQYLDRLTNQERNGLQQLLDGLLRISTQYFRKKIYSYGLLAVGTVTYDDHYWQNLESYLKEEPTLKPILKNKGEDIDLFFCPEFCGNNLLTFFEKEYALRFNKQQEPTHEEIFSLRKKLKNTANFKTRTLTQDEEFLWTTCYDFRTLLTGVAIENEWKHTPWTDGASFGAHYFKIPESQLEQGGQNIARIKGKNWGVENMSIRMPDCRPFHIYVDDRDCFLHKINYERIINLPFAVLCSAYTYHDLHDQIDIKNGVYVQQKNTPSKVQNRLASKKFGPVDDLPF